LLRIIMPWYCHSYIGTKDLSASRVRSGSTVTDCQKSVTVLPERTRDTKSLLYDVRVTISWHNDLQQKSSQRLLFDYKCLVVLGSFFSLTTDFRPCRKCSKLFGHILKNGWNVDVLRTCFAAFTTGNAGRWLLCLFQEFHSHCYCNGRCNA